MAGFIGSCQRLILRFLGDDEDDHGSGDDQRDTMAIKDKPNSFRL
jgi:hypothetical protein